ncbi:FliH Flagellar biosynthesis/type III secretory pathway protein [Burkholderiales bacterium]
MFDAELWPRKRPPVRSKIAKPAQAGALFQEQTHTDIELSLTAKKGNSGFKKGLPEKVVHKPFLLPFEAKPVIQGTHEVPPSEEPAGTPMMEEAPITPEPAEPEAAAPEGAEPEATAPEASETLPAEALPELAASGSDENDLPESTASPEDGVSRHLLDEAALEEMRQQAFAEGRAEGLVEGLTRGQQEAAEGARAELDAQREALIEQGRTQARDELEAQLRDEFEAPARAAADRLNKLADDLARQARDTTAFHEPMKRLAMHLAEQMVRGELSLSSAAISRLIDRSLAELGQETRSPVAVYLNPSDLAQIKAGDLQPPDTLELRAEETLTPGSLRVSMNGAVIEDMIETRHKALWRALVQDEQAEPPASFLKNMDLVKEAMDDVLDEVIDAD